MLTPRSGLQKRGAAECLNRPQGVWIVDETLVRVFDIASQHKFAKFYGYLVSHVEGSDFLIFSSLIINAF